MTIILLNYYIIFLIYILFVLTKLKRSISDDNKLITCPFETFSNEI